MKIYKLDFFNIKKEKKKLFSYFYDVFHFSFTKWTIFFFLKNYLRALKAHLMPTWFNYYIDDFSVTNST